MKFAMQFNKYFRFDFPTNTTVRCHCAGRKKKLHSGKLNDWLKGAQSKIKSVLAIAEPMRFSL